MHTFLPSAEGCELPVPQALACGTHLIVSSEGAADDGVPQVLGYRQPSRQRTAQDQSRCPDSL
ncbi:MAG TPA: hypothetical protein VEE84_01540 [Burkholderiaceae bacterium]|nr:hypothetical protein [Burkholderiaceae bacterium]